MTPFEHVIRRYTFKLYPNKAQALALDDMRRLHCRLYNAALQQRIDVYRNKDHAKHEIVCVGTYSNAAGEERGKYRTRHLSDGAGVDGKTLGHFDQGKDIKIIRAHDPAYEALSADSLSFTLKRLDLAYQAFFRRAKAGEGAQSGFPHYKRSDDYPGFTHRPGQGWRFDVKPKAKSGKTTFKGVPGAVKWRGEFPMFPYGIKTGDVMLRAGVWWLSVVADVPARMRADEDHSGEVTFDLVDSFARVSRANSGHTAGPEETVFAAANGRITPVVSKGYQEAPAETLQTEGDRGWSRQCAGRCPPAETLQTEGDRGDGSVRSSFRNPAETLQTEGDRGRWRSCARSKAPAETLQTEGDRGVGEERRPDRRPAETLQTEGDRGVVGAVTTPKLPAETLQTEGDRGVNVTLANGSLPAETLQTARGHGRIKRGSCQDRSNKRREARRQARAARQRREALHLWTTGIARRFATLKITSPPLVEATQSGRGDAYEHGAEVALKAALNRRVLDQAPGAAIAMLEYKIAERGGVTETIVAAGPVMVGNEIVEARKAARKTTRKPKRPRT